MRFVLCLIYFFIGALIFAIPNMTRRGILFAVPVPANFRESSEGRRSIAMFRALVATAVLGGLGALLFLPDGVIAHLAVADPFIVLLVGAAGFFWQKRKLAPFAVQPSQPREVEVTGAPDDLPWFAWLGAAPFAIVLIAAAFLQTNWERIPARFPVHWGADGQPNRWGDRSIHGVYGPLLFAVELCGWLLILALAGWFGARRSRFRRVMFGAGIGIENMIGLLFAVMSINAIIHIPVWVPLLGPMLFLVPMLIAMTREIAEPGDSVEPTPNECWKGGVIYYNPDDAALFVEKRAGLGYTFNFGNRWSWVLMASLVLVLASGRFLL